jgi:hypothetical protein
MEEALKNWLTDHQNIEYKALPLIICWGIWISWNKAIFENKQASISHTSLQSINILTTFPQKIPSSSLCQKSQPLLP